MNKDNVFRSSNFYMAKGDVLHMIIADETGAESAVAIYNSSDDLPETEIARDYDGNAYNMVRIGNIMISVENFKGLHYNDGSSIPNLQTDVAFLADANGAKAGGYMVYNNDGLQDIYGYLYSWYVIDNAAGIAPTGCRVATKADIEYIQSYYGALAVNNAIRDTGTLYWEFPNDNANNLSGLSVLPTGVRNAQYTLGVWHDPTWEKRNGSMGGMGWVPQSGFFWLDEFDADAANYVQVPHSQEYGYDDFIGISQETKPVGMAIKFVKDV